MTIAASARAAHAPSRELHEQIPGEDSRPPVTLIIGGAETGGRFAVIETVEYAGAEPPRHRHHWEDELLYVLDGELAIFVNGAWSRACAGRAVLLRRGVEHSFTVLTGMARVLTIYAPAGFEAWYSERRDEMLDRGVEEPSVERFVAAAARYGCEVTGPHPGRPPIEPAER